MSRRIRLVPSDPSWPAEFQVERKAVEAVFAPILVSTHHIGSTSVPHLLAKPVIDILVVVRDDSGLSDFDEGMIGLGYTPRGECLDAGGTPGRFYYSKTVDGIRTHQVHVCAAGHFEIDETLRFTQYLRERHEVADAYGRLKLKAATECDFDNAAYMALKHDWVRDTVREALAHYGEADHRPHRSEESSHRDKSTAPTSDNA